MTNPKAITAYVCATPTPDILITACVRGHEGSLRPQWSRPRRRRPSPRFGSSHAWSCRWNTSTVLTGSHVVVPDVLAHNQVVPESLAGRRQPGRPRFLGRPPGSVAALRNEREMSLSANEVIFTLTTVVTTPGQRTQIGPSAPTWFERFAAPRRVHGASNVHTATQLRSLSC